jgi:hypothetical protein
MEAGGGTGAVCGRTGRRNAGLFAEFPGNGSGAPATQGYKNVGGRN